MVQTQNLQELKFTLIMVAKLEANKIGKGWVYVVEEDPVLQKRQGNGVAALPTTLPDGEIHTYYTLGQDSSLVKVDPDDEGKGCWVNEDKLDAGESVVIGNLKITGA